MGGTSRRNFLAGSLAFFAAPVPKKRCPPMLPVSQGLLNQTNIDSRDSKFQAMLEQLQGNILASHGRDHSLHIFLKFKPAVNAVKDWIRQFASNHITSARQQVGEAERFRREGVPGKLFAGFLMSASGYEVIGVGYKKFLIGTQGGRPFVRGMRKAGGELNDPPVEKWEAGFQDSLHAVVFLAGDNKEELERAGQEIRQEVSQVATVVNVEKGAQLRRNGQAFEPFGYADDLSQPLFFKAHIERARKQGTEKWDPSAPLNQVLIQDPHGPDEFSFGSYLVYRKLEQNVAGFKSRRRELAQLLGVNEELAGAFIVGRFRDGTPVVLQSAPDSQSLTNNFDYADDLQGSKCPFHSHIRKTNPRGDLNRQVGFSTDNERQHRIVRRGVPYGMEDLEAKPATGAGLLFMCYQSDICNQFEFMQQAWANEKRFVKRGVGLDAVVGSGFQSPGGQRWLRKWGAEERMDFDFSGFVTLRGGEYFFAPSISFLRQIK